MLRKDLLPGDVFYYSDNDPKHTYYVWPQVTGQPKTSFGRSGGSCLNDRVTLIWRDPEQGGMPSINSEPNPNPTPEGPKHYTSQTPEPIAAIEGWGLNFRLANVVKYVARAGKKEGVPAVKDLKKAIRYLAREINAQEGKKSWEYEVS